MPEEGVTLMLGLDPRQQAAVDTGAVDVCIGAGAGSGKTRVLTARYLSAVLGIPPYAGSDPHELLTVTFTDKAAAELAERVRAALIAEGRHDAARRTGDAWISTIHTMCSRILRENALDAGIDPDFQILDQVEASVIESEALEHALSETMELPDVRALLDMYGEAGVLAAAQSVRSAVRSLGLDVTAVQTVPAEEALTQLAAIGRRFREIGASLCALPSIKTIESCASAVERVAGVVEELCVGTEPERLRAALSEISTTSMTRRDVSAHEYRPLAEEAHDLVNTARTCVAQLMARDLEEGFMTFLVAFDRHYDAMKRARGALDFEDLQVVTARLLAERPDVAAGLRARFAMVMVDEFQDTNELQLSIVERLSDGTLCTVGDENQSIYAFRHADVAVFRQRLERVSTHVDLDVNYRIEPSLLASLNALFSHRALLGAHYRPLKPGRQLSPGRETRLQVRFVDQSACEADAVTSEARAIAARVRDHIRDGVAPGDIAILMARMVGGRAAAVERELRSLGIPVVLASGGTFFRCPEVAEARSLLRVIDNVLDDEAVVELLTGRLTGLSPESMLVLRRHADERVTGDPRSGAHLWPSVAEIPSGLPSDEARALIRTVEAVRSARRRRGAIALSELLIEALLAMDADLVYFALGADGVRAWANVMKIAAMARAYESADGGGIQGFLEHLEVRERHGGGESGAVLEGELDAVRVMSIHASKGLEFPQVIVGGFGQGKDLDSIAFARFDGVPLLGLRLRLDEDGVASLGHARVQESAKEIARAEAKRLLYVACTRARERLTIVVRADPDNDAGDDQAGWVRQAVGCGAAGSLEQRVEPLGEGAAQIVVWRPEQVEQSVQAPPAVSESVTTAQRTAPSVPSPASGTPDTHAAQDAVAHTQNDAPPRPARRVSYTGLGTYMRCPYRFYLTSVLRLPQPGSAAADARRAFGDAVHAVLERCECPGDVPSGTVDAALVAHGLAPEERPRLERAVAAFLSSPLAQQAYAASVVRREAPICVQVGQVTLVGSIDLLAQQGPDALVVDYKTGAGADDGDEACSRYELQASCYGLAALAAGARTVRVVFVEIERGGTHEYVFGAGDRDSLQERIGAIAEAIAHGAFEPLSAYQRGLCDTCPGLGGMCPVRRPRGGGAV